MKLSTFIKVRYKIIKIVLEKAFASLPMQIPAKSKIVGAISIFETSPSKADPAAM
jgi:hypothetical protein